MHCYACDMLLENAALDKPTGRYYCQTCMEPTNEVILKMQDNDLEDYKILDIINKSSVEEISLNELEELENEEESEEE